MNYSVIRQGKIGILFIEIPVNHVSVLNFTIKRKSSIGIFFIGN